jgi:DNA (cytosine-5)-methyltransferase 1
VNELSLFTGAGGGVLGTHLLGWRPVGYVEFNDYCQRVLAARIRDGHIPNAPIFGDIRAFLDEGWAAVYQGMVDVVTAGFPCQPFSVAGKRRGEDDERNMWPATAEVIRLVRPRWCLLENVPGLLAGSHGYFGQVLSELASMGYDARWGVLGARHVGAPHRRDRLWVLANAQGTCWNRGSGGKNCVCAHFREDIPGEWNNAREVFGADHMDFISPDTASWKSESGVCLVVDGLANHVDRLHAAGNGQVPAVVRLAWETLA